LAVLCRCALATASPARAGEEAAYRLVRGFPQLPAGIKLGAVAGVATDAAGASEVTGARVQKFVRAKPE
jgi:hypothetical protein